MPFSVLMQENLVIFRPSEDQGYPDEFGNWVTAVDIQTIPMKGSIQPYRSTDFSKGEESLPSRDGFDKSYARTVYTDQLVQPVDRKKNREPDTINIDGVEYVCWDVFDHLNAPMVDLRHCQSVFVERARLELMLQ